jgi:hypothetical protein
MKDGQDNLDTDNSETRPPNLDFLVKIAGNGTPISTEGDHSR